MSVRQQGSASYTIVLVGVLALLIGGIMLTFVVYPLANAFMGSAFWSAATTPGSRLLGIVGGVWTFWGAIILLSILSYVWISTRQ